MSCPPKSAPGIPENWGPPKRQSVNYFRETQTSLWDFWYRCWVRADSDTVQTPVARGSVYYEAGFSHGLGKDVIWTCHKDLIDHIHFDLRQYACIPWEEGREEDLREALVSRIRAVIV